MGLKLASSEPTKEVISIPPSSLESAATLVMISLVVGGLIVPVLNITIIESSTYSLASTNSAINIGADSYGYY